MDKFNKQILPPLPQEFHFGVKIIKVYNFEKQCRATFTKTP